jgi:hypothetical protein
MKSRVLKTTALVGASVLILGAFVAGPAQAKKKKKTKKPVACAPITPFEDAKDAPLQLVTDAATKDAPITLTVSTEQGLGTTNPDTTHPDPTDDPTSGGSSHAFVNAQVDSAAPDAYLYGRLEFPGNTDYDLLFRGSDGVATYFSAGSAPYVDPTGFVGSDGTGHGGHSEGGPTGAAENIDGAPTADCAGYSVDVSGSTTPGGDVTLKLWLGEAPTV